MVVNNFPLDPIVTGPVVSLAEHTHIHRGTAFYCSVPFFDFKKNNTADILIRTGERPTHIRRLMITTTKSPIVYYFYEAPTVTSVFTPFQIQNCNRIASEVPFSTVFIDPIVSSMGTYLDCKITDQSGHSSAETPLEWVLKPNMDYLIRIVNSSSGKADLMLSFWFYEPRAQGE